MTYSTVDTSMEIRLEPGLPTMAVDVVDADFSVLQTVMVSATAPATIAVAPAGSFLRVHLPSGRTVKLRDSNSPQLLVTADSLGGRPGVRQTPQP